MKKTLRRTGAVLGTATLASMATVGPTYAADTVAQSSANALTIAVAGNANGSGTVTATHDGQSLQKDGATNPPISVLRNQDLLDIGTLAQDATAGVDGRDGVSAACSGVAGDGATLAEVGEGNCLTGGDNIGISMGNLDLTGAVLINPASALGPLSEPLQPLMADGLAPISAALSEALAAVPIDISGTAGVIEARCEASPGTATGDARITDAEVFVTVGTGATAERITLLNLPTRPDPNTKVVTDLDEVVNAVLQAVEVQLLEGLQGVLGEGAQITEALQTQVVTPLIGQIADQLAPLEENVLDGTLNKQSKSDGKISVTAVDLQVLPAAREFIDASLASVSIANVTCGPNGRVQPEAPAAPDAPDAPAPAEPNLPAVPTVVDSGAGSDAASWEAALYAGGTVAAAGFAGLLGYRRFAVSR